MGKTRWVRVQELAWEWALPPREIRRLTEAAAGHLAACEDIAACLQRLLRDRTLIRNWLRREHPQLLHARPIDLILTSYGGCRALRAMLIAELVQLDPGDAIAAAALSGSSP